MFTIRLEARYGETMRECDIEAATTIASEMKKLNVAALHVHNINHTALRRECKNFSRAARNIIRVYNFLDEAEWELESLHDCYIAQFTDFDYDGEIIDNMPDFDFSEQSILDEKALDHYRNAYELIVRAVLDFAKFAGINTDENFFSLLNKDNLLKFIGKFISPAIHSPKNTTSATTFSANNTVFFAVRKANRTIRNNRAKIQPVKTL